MSRPLAPLDAAARILLLGPLAFLLLCFLVLALTWPPAPLPAFELDPRAEEGSR